MKRQKANLRLMLSRIGLMLFGLLVGLIVAEAVFRTLRPDPSPKLIHQGLQLHPTYGISFTPNAEGWNTNLQGILYLELLPALQASQAKTAELLYYQYDGHWRPAGHVVAAETIYNYLIQNQDKFKNFPRH